MNPARRATPDSEALGSSEDERPWPSSTSFGHMAMRESGMPGLPGGIWAQKRGSFKMADSAKRNALHDVRLGTGNPAQSALRVGSTPSPSTSDRAGSLPFAIPLQPIAKTGRSLSHSQGQREFLPVQNSHAMLSAQHAATMPLGLLAEEVDTETESDLGGRLTHTISHPPIGSLFRNSTLPATYDALHGLGNGRTAANDFSQPHIGNGHDRRLENSFANLSFADAPSRNPQWQSSLGWDGVRNVNESRRHSLADIPTRRGSVVGGESGMFARTFSHDTFESDEPAHAMAMSSNFSGFNSADRAVNTQGDSIGVSHTHNGSFDIPHNYRVPQVDLNERERNEINSNREQAPGTMQQWGASNGNRPRKQLFVVSFKCSRVDIFYLLENTGLTVREGDLVIVEADRGQDLGTVQHANVSPEIARVLKKKYSEEQYKWLMMYSHNKEGGNNPNAELQRDNTDRPYYASDAPSSIQGSPSFSRDSVSNLKPKAIKRLAQHHEIKMLAEKEGNEAKAKRTCQQKVAHLRLQMEILDAEWQWDFQKLIFYYYADHYINFKDLITELYRIYKTRIWLSAINPASFSQHAINQPPSGIGPGAVTPFNPYGLNNAYTMAYGEDRDPYGAQMPYRIGYETYTPNFPGIPGVPNSFAPGVNPYMMGLFQGSASGHDAPTSPMHTQSPATHATENLASLVDQNGLTQRQTYDFNSLYTFGPNVRSGDGQFLPQTSQQGEGQRPNYSFGPRNPQSFTPTNSWDRNVRGSNNGNTTRQSTLPNPIGTRPMSNGQEFGISSEHQRQANAMDPQAARFTARANSNASFSPSTTLSGLNGSSHQRGNGELATAKR